MMKNKENPRVREKLLLGGVPYWKLAPRLGISETTLYRMLRTELPEDKQNELIALIDQIADEEE